jgi:WD40 repeat protein
MLILKGHNSAKPVRSLAFSPDGAHLGSSARDYQTRLWNLNTGESRVLEPGYADSYTVAFSPDGAVVATGKSSRCTLYTVATGALQNLDVERGGYPALQVAYAPDGSVLGAAGNEVCLWDARTLQPIALGDERLHACGCLAFSRDGKTLATGHTLIQPGKAGRQQFVRLWDFTTRSVRGELRGHTAEAEALAFSPDGRLLAVAAARRLLVWNVADGSIALELKHGSESYKDVAFSPDGRYLAFARNDATVRLCEVNGWREAASYDWKLGPMISVAFAPDSMRAAAGSGRGKIVVWDVDL